MSKIFRPLAPEGKIGFKDSFELCYMRHTYLRRVNYNPTEAEMEPYMKIVTSKSRQTLAIYNNVLQLNGFSLDDVVNIGRVFLTCFLGLSALEKNQDKYDKFVESFTSKNGVRPSLTDIENKNKASFTSELKQRMETLVRVSRQKARNIKGFTADDFQSFYGPIHPPEDVRLLLDNHEEYYFKKIDLASFRSIKKKMKVRNGEIPFQFAGYWYVAVKIEKRTLCLEDFIGAGLDPRDNIHNRNPEELLISSHDEEEFDKKKLMFDNHPKETKKSILMNFVTQNKGNPNFKEEVTTARKYLKTLSSSDMLEL